MKNAPLPVRTQWAFIRALLRDYNRVARLPRGARLIFMAGVYFTDARVSIVKEMMFQAGAWELARKFLVGKMSAESLAKLTSWAARVKGGAS